MERIFFILLIIGLVSCSNNTEMVESKNDSGNILERYSRKVDNYDRHGIYQRFYANGTIEEEAYYQNDTLEGQRILFYETGDTLIIEHYQKGIFHGDYYSFHSNGAIESKGQYLNGVMGEAWEYFYDNAQLKERVFFVDNEENGPFVEYYKNGNIKAKGTYKTTSKNIDGNKEHGLLELYDENGELERKMNCDLGVCRTSWSREDSEKKI